MTRLRVEATDEHGTAALVIIATLTACKTMFLGRVTEDLSLSWDGRVAIGRETVATVPVPVDMTAAQAAAVLAGFACDRGWEPL